MKRQFQICAATFITVAFISCSKENADIEESQKIISEESATERSSGDGVIRDPWTVKLEGRFEFDGNLKEKSNKLPGGFPTSRGAGKYGIDRHGNANKALFLDGNYGVTLPKIPQQSNSSLSVWLFIGNTYSHYENRSPIFGKGPSIWHQYQWKDWEGKQYHTFSGGVVRRTDYNETDYYAPNSNAWVDYQFDYDVPSNMIFGTWRHLVVTYDGIFVNFYIDGQKVGVSKTHPTSITPHFEVYQVGFPTPSFHYEYFSAGYWIGKMDDLRFYSRTLTSTEVQQLYNQ